MEVLLNLMIALHALCAATAIMGHTRVFGTLFWAASRTNQERELRRRLGFETRCATLTRRQLAINLKTIFLTSFSSGTVQKVGEFFSGERQTFVHFISEGFFLHTSLLKYLLVRDFNVGTQNRWCTIFNVLNSSHPRGWQGLLDLGC